MLYITTTEDGEILGACDGPEVNMTELSDTWIADHIDIQCGPKPTTQGALSQWYRKREDILQKLYEQYGSTPQFGFRGLWAKVLVKDFKYVARVFKRSL